MFSRLKIQFLNVEMKQKKMNSRHAEHSARGVENEMDKMYPKTERTYMTK